MIAEIISSDNYVRPLKRTRRGISIVNIALIQIVLAVLKFVTSSPFVRPFII